MKTKTNHVLLSLLGTELIFLIFFCLNAGSSEAITSFGNIIPLYPNINETIYYDQEVPIQVRLLPRSNVNASMDNTVNVTLHVINTNNGMKAYSEIRNNVHYFDYIQFVTDPLEGGSYYTSFTIENQDGATISYDFDTFPFAVSKDISTYIDADSYTGMNDFQITFNAEHNASPYGTIVSYDWNFDDGITGTGATISHLFHGSKEQSIFDVSLGLIDENTHDDETLISVGNIVVPSATPFTMTVDKDYENSLYSANEEPPFFMIKLWFDDQPIDPTTQYLILSRSAESADDITSLPYSLMSATKEYPLRFIDGVTPFHRYVQYKVQEVVQGYNVYSQESDVLYNNAMPFDPWLYMTSSGSTVSTYYRDPDGDSGKINFRAIRITEPIEDGEQTAPAPQDLSFLDIPVSYAGSYNCPDDIPEDPSVIVASRSVSANNDQPVQWKITKPGNFYICAQSEDVHGEKNPWAYEFTKFGSHIIVGGGVFIITVLPSVTSGGGVSNISPDAPALISPIDSQTFETGDDISMTAQYNDFNKDDGYLFFRVSDDIDCTSAITEGKGTTIKSGEQDTWTIPQPLDPGAYYWCAKAFDTYGYDSIWSASNKFTVSSSPAVLQPSVNENKQENKNAGTTGPVGNFNGHVVGEYEGIPGTKPPVTPPFNPNQNVSAPVTNTNQNVSIPEVDTSKADIDEDTFTDFNEQFIFNTEPGNPISKPNPLQDIVTISNIHDNDTITSSMPFVVGQARADSTVFVFALDTNGKEQELGHTTADLEGRYALTSTVVLENGIYKMYARGFDAEGNLFATSPDIINITIDDSFSMPAPVITWINDQPYVEGEPVLVYTPKPMFSGTYVGDGEIYAFWQSIVTGSQGILSPLEDQTFTVQPEEPLSVGPHSVSIYLALKEGESTILGKLATINFEVKPASENPALGQTENPSEQIELPIELPVSEQKTTSMNNTDIIILSLGTLILLTLLILVWNNWGRKKQTIDTQ